MGGAQGGKGKRPISVKFEIPYFTTSGIQVRYLKIIEPKVSECVPSAERERAPLPIFPFVFACSRLFGFRFDPCRCCPQRCICAIEFVALALLPHDGRSCATRAGSPARHVAERPRASRVAPESVGRDPLGLDLLAWLHNIMHQLLSGLCPTRATAEHRRTIGKGPAVASCSASFGLTFAALFKC